MMRITPVLALIGALVAPCALLAEQAARSTDFDYLLGDWEFTAVSKQWGRFHGRWSATALAEGQILDEYRVVGDEGETYYVTTTLRNFNRHTGVWDLVGADAGGGLGDVGTARRVGDEIHIEQILGADSEAPSRWRIRYYAIHSDRFSWVADVSKDGGTTWETQFQTLEALRVGPPRHLPALTPTRPLSDAGASATPATQVTPPTGSTLPTEATLPGP